MKKQYFLLLLLLSSLNLLQASWAVEDPQPSEANMANHGYSDETIRLMTLQQTRMEGKEAPPPTQTRRERFLDNLLFNHWTRSLDEFGYDKIRENEQ